MKQDIVLNGVSINELLDAKQKIQKDAAKLIADSIDNAKRLVDNIFVCQDEDKIQSCAEEALEHLEVADIVSGVSGVTYFLQWDQEYAEEEAYTTKFDEIEYTCEEGIEEEHKVLYNLLTSDNKKLKNLYNKLCQMENQSYGWHNSNCY